MPIAIFPQVFELQLRAVLQRKIGEATRKEQKKITVDKARLLFIATKFLKLYRENLTTSSVYTNLNIPSVYYPGPLGGYPSVTEAMDKPLLGAIGLPGGMQGIQYALTEKIKLGQYAKIQIKADKEGSQRGFLTFDFRKFSEDQMARYHDGSSTVSWVRLIEYGFDVNGHVYVPKIGAGRSDFGIMQPSKRFDFTFAATHLFEDTFRLTKEMLTSEERSLLLATFLE
jgi:hypothetical protein